MRWRVSPEVLAKLDLDAARREYVSGEAVFDEACGQGEVRILVSGVAAEARLLSDGRRQILALRLPGDALTPNAGDMVVALTRVRVVNGARLVACLGDASPEFQPLRRAWVTAGRIDQAILRDQVVRLGCMSAQERMAHVLLEVHERLAQVGLVRDTTFHMPLTQEAFGQVIGISVVHLNRTLQALRREGLVVARQGFITLVDRARLVDMAAYVSPFPVPWAPSASVTTRRADGGVLELAR